MDSGIYEKFKDGVGYGPAFREASASKLPGQHNGPGDAYRHIIGAAEITRRHGETAARTILEANEIKGDITVNQPGKERKMDKHNNEIGIAIGKQSKNYEEIVGKARKKIDESVSANGSGAQGTAKWLDQSEWHDNIKNPNWPPNWSKVEPSEKDYKYKGKENNYEQGSSGEQSGGQLKEQKMNIASDSVVSLPTTIMERSIETWSKNDLHEVMKSDAYQYRSAPGHKHTQELVGAWFKHFYGAGTVDATGRMIDATPIREIPKGGPKGGGGPVHVNAYVRDGGHVSVHSYNRSRPSR